MELQQLNNTTISGINSANISHTQKTNSSEAIDKLDNVTVEVDFNDKNNIRSELANNVSKYINTISTASSVTSILKNQIQVMDDIGDKISTPINRISSQDDLQTDVAHLISKFNNSTGIVNEKIDKLSDLEGDSTTYFDGTAGAIPLNVDMLTNSMATKRDELLGTLNKVQEVNAVFKAMARDTINSEIQKSQDTSPFKEINFGKESANFNSTNMSNLVGSVASSQANAIPSQNIRLLS